MRPWRTSPDIDGPLLGLITFFLLALEYLAFVELPLPIGITVSLVLSIMALVTGRLTVIILKG